MRESHLDREGGVGEQAGLDEVRSRDTKLFKYRLNLWVIEQSNLNGSISC